MRTRDETSTTFRPAWSQTENQRSFLRTERNRRALNNFKFNDTNTPSNEKLPYSPPGLVGNWCAEINFQWASSFQKDSKEPPLNGPCTVVICEQTKPVNVP
jgi:hypothetical protein